MSAWRDIAGDPATGLLLISDHASARVPDGIDLGIAPELMYEHVAIDIGVAPLGERLARSLRCPAILGNVSRLVVDLNREVEAPGLIPERSDGHAISGNVGLGRAERAARIDRLWRPYHAHIADIILVNQPRLLISLHSFTPRLREAGPPRPWQIGILYNADDRAARIATPALAAAGMVVGDNEPYSGKALNATMNRHGEANGIAYLGLEVRQDLIGDEAGVAEYAELLAPVIAATRDALA